jgi:hypothetical protein
VLSRLNVPSPVVEGFLRRCKPRCGHAKLDPMLGVTCASEPMRCRPGQVGGSVAPVASGGGVCGLGRKSPSATTSLRPARCIPPPARMHNYPAERVFYAADRRAPPLGFA